MWFLQLVFGAKISKVVFAVALVAGHYLFPQPATFADRFGEWHVVEESQLSPAYAGMYCQTYPTAQSCRFEKQKVVLKKRAKPASR